MCLRAMTRLLPVGHGEEQVQYADMLVTANEAERRRHAQLCGSFSNPVAPVTVKPQLDGATLGWVSPSPAQQPHLCRGSGSLQG